ncbi:large ribosomal subunit protein uL1-like isoform X2 [Dysidea avara]|uniref:large ribosomal subunit protein uL1-like isoform X2 n=1 Tax=Dysidea avara TaxID=196820 RepID=UPI00331E4F7E
MFLSTRVRVVRKEVALLCRRRINDVYLIKKRRPLQYSMGEAFNALRCYSFQEDETVNTTLICDLRTKHKERLRNPFRGRVTYPHQFGHKPTVLLICEEEAKDAAKAAKVDIVGGMELVKQIVDSKVNFDICLCTTKLYPKVQPLQKELKQHMPHPRRGKWQPLFLIIILSISTREYKSDTMGKCIMPIGQLNFPLEHLQVNFKRLVEEVFTHRENMEVEKFIINIFFSTTFGPSYLIDKQEMFALEPKVETNEWSISSL